MQSFKRGENFSDRCHQFEFEFFIFYFSFFFNWLFFHVVLGCIVFAKLLVVLRARQRTKGECPKQLIIQKESSPLHTKIDYSFL